MRATSSLFRIAPAALALALASPALAASGADGDWACHTLIGIAPVVYLSLAGTDYVLTRPDGTTARGTVTYNDSPITGFTVDPGPLASGFDAAEGILANADRLYFDGRGGGISLMCEPGVPGGQ